MRRTRSQTPLASRLVLAGLLAYDLGGLLFRHLGDNRAGRGGRILGRRIGVNRTLVFGALGAAVAVTLVGQIGGFENVFASRTDFTLRIVDRTGDTSMGLLLFMTFLRVPVFIAAYLLFICFWSIERSPRLLLALIALVSLSVLLHGATANPFTRWFAAQEARR